MSPSAPQAPPPLEVLQELASFVEGAAPDTAPVTPLWLVEVGFGNVVLETRSGIIFRLALTPDVAAAHARQCRVLPAISRIVTTAVPVPTWYWPALSAAPFGMIGYRRLRGDRVDTAALGSSGRQHLGRHVGRFLSELHTVPLNVLADAALPDFDPGAALTERDSEIVLDGLAPLVHRDELRLIGAWCERFHGYLPADTHTRVLCHGDLWYRNLLVSQKSELVGVLDWDAMVVSDPAWDLAPAHYLGPEFVRAVTAAYLGAPRDPHLIPRSLNLLVLREILGAVWAARKRPEELPCSSEKIVTAIRLTSEGECR